jgi:hypothetical protein
MAIVGVEQLPGTLPDCRICHPMVQPHAVIEQLTQLISIDSAESVVNELPSIRAAGICEIVETLSLSRIRMESRNRKVWPSS